MASQFLHNRYKIVQTKPPTTTTTNLPSIKTKPEPKAIMTKPEPKAINTKRALRSLAVFIIVPLILTVAIIIFFGSGRRYRALAKPFWFPPLWLIHLSSFGLSFCMSLAAWLVWADGGFHAESDALPLYIAQVSLGVVWDPLMLVIGAAWLGWFFSVVHFGTLFACYKTFRKVNPFAKDLVKPCLVWIGFLTLVNFKLIYL